MFKGINPKMLKQAMKKLGMKQEEIEAEEVIIKCKDKELVIRDPKVSKVDAMGQETFQVAGTVEEQPLEKFTEEDVETVMQQTNSTKENARKALEEADGNLAEAILKLKETK